MGLETGDYAVLKDGNDFSVGQATPDGRVVCLAKTVDLGLPTTFRESVEQRRLTAELITRALNWYTKRVAGGEWSGVVVVGPEPDPAARSYRGRFDYFDPDAPELDRVELAAMFVGVSPGVWLVRLKRSRGAWSVGGRLERLA